MSTEYLITRRGTDVSQNTDRRVYVTGPHFGDDIFSSTEDRSEASRFSRDEATRLVSKWHRLEPAIEKAG